MEPLVESFHCLSGRCVLRSFQQGGNLSPLFFLKPFLGRLDLFVPVRLLGPFPLPCQV